MTYETIDTQAIPWFGYHRRRCNEMYALRVAGTLAAAVKFRIPILSVLECLHADFRRSSGIVRIWDTIGWNEPRRCSPPMWDPAIRWSIRLKRLIRDLSEGAPLGLAVERHMGSSLPRYYVLALQKAEIENRLEAVLPLMAKRIQYQCAIVDDRVPYMPFLIFQVSMILLVFSMYQTLIVPIFFEMARSFDSAPPPLAVTLLSGLNAVLTWCFIIGVGVFFLMKSTVLREALLPWVPLVAREKRRLLVRDLAHSMVAFLASGEDVVNAARWCLKATTSPWLKMRLEKFVGLVSGGENWALAWESMKLGSYTYPWLIANAAARQDPMSGFESLAEWLHQDISHTTRSLRRWFTPCIVIVLGMLVLTIASTLFLMLSGMWKHFFVP